MEDRDRYGAMPFKAARAPWASFTIDDHLEITNDRGPGE